MFILEMLVITAIGYCFIESINKKPSMGIFAYIVLITVVILIGLFIEISIVNW